MYAWRRHLAASAGRIVDQETASAWMAVGFADLVGFTRLSRQISETELARLVERFESRSADIVASSGGRMIKTLGDSVLWVSDSAARAADIALSLIQAHARVRGMPELRVGLAIGPVIGRMGDVFGTTVNLASRLTSLAPAGASWPTPPSRGAGGSSPLRAAGGEPAGRPGRGPVGALRGDAGLRRSA